MTRSEQTTHGKLMKASVLRHIFLAATLTLAACTTPSSMKLDAPGEQRLTASDIVDVVLAATDRTRVDPLFPAIGSVSRIGVETGVIWTRVFRGDDRSIARLSITKAELRESMSGMGFTMRYTYVAEAEVVIGDRAYPVRAEGTRAAAMANLSAMRQAVELGIADIGRQAAAILALEKQKRPKQD